MAEVFVAEYSASAHWTSRGSAMVRALYIGLVLIISTSDAIGERTDPDRVAIQKGSFQGCLEKMPAEVRARFGRLAMARFCSCYASKIADTITQTQIDALPCSTRTARMTSRVTLRR